MRKRLSPPHLGDSHSQKFPSVCLYLPVQIWRPLLNFVCTWAHELGNPSCGKEGRGQVGERMAGALVQLWPKFWHGRARKRGKFSRHRFGYEAPVPRGPGSQLPPSRPPQKMGAREKAITADPPTSTFPGSRASTGNAATVHTHSSSS